MMTSKERFLKALRREKPDRLPVTTHHVMNSFLKQSMNGISNQDFFDRFGFDPICWSVPHTCDESKGEYFDPEQTEIGFLESKRVCTDNWRFKIVPLDGFEKNTNRFEFITPEKTLSMILQSDRHTTWVKEHLIKEKTDIDIIAKYMTSPKCDLQNINQTSEEYGERGLIRGHICTFDGFGQPGCWQDLACLYGVEKLIMASFDDPDWVHTCLRVLQKRKLIYIDSLRGARYDILELGGGDASTTVISPKIFDEFVAPYDAKLIDRAHAAGQRIVYHTCGGMMPILERIVAMKPDAMETFTPPSLGGDTRLAEAKRRIGDKVCMIGGFDQFHFFTKCSPEETRREVRRCFETAGADGGYIIAPSDHFFEAEESLLFAFADEAHKCVYEPKNSS
jgi:uroporphyrinogen decarboxylase